jgi:hypothetical protein
VSATSLNRAPHGEHDVDELGYVIFRNVRLRKGKWQAFGEKLL